MDYFLILVKILGGSFLILNFFSHSIIIGLVLGYTILNYVPNTIHGIKVSNPPVIAQAIFYIFYLIIIFYHSQLSKFKPF